MAVLLMAGCGGRRDNRSAESTESQSAATTAERYHQAVEHYWDGFDFEAGERIKEYDTVELVYAMADYVMMIEPADADSLLRGLIRRAEASRPVLDMFATISEMVLHHPNSPLRNDEYYIPILEALIASPLYDEYDRIAPAHDLAIARQNRIGHVANDFEITLADGNALRLHAIVAEYTILMFSNPGCSMCRDIRTAIEASELLRLLDQSGHLAIVTVYPDEDIAAWREYLPKMPAAWINGYDKGARLSHERLYNLNAIPSLYLLDSQKRVMVKDGTDVAYIESVIADDYTKKHSND